MWITNYCGPAIICKTEPQEVPTTTRVCPKCFNKKKVDGAFCSNCGTKIQSTPGKPTTVIKPTVAGAGNDWELAFEAANLDVESLEILYGELADGCHIVVPNQGLVANESRGWPRKFASGGKSFYMPEEEFDIEAEKQWLEMVFNSEIKVLQTLYKSILITWIFNIYAT